MKSYRIIHQDCMEWIDRHEPASIHAVCTDPPYGLVEFSATELAKLRAGTGGVWRLPPVMNGCKRDPLPRFTVLSEAEKSAVEAFFARWGAALLRVMVPGGHVLVAGNSHLQHYIQRAMAQSGFEVRGAIARVYQGFRGGDRPKNAEKEFPDVCVTLKGYYEPWMLFRKPLGERTVAANLRKWKTGGLRMLEDSRPFPEVVMSGRSPRHEDEIAPHPCLKPQHFMRLVVRALLPLGEGTVLDPFMGAGSTIAAAEAVGYQSIGIELDREYFELAERAIPELAALYPDFKGETLAQPTSPIRTFNSNSSQLALAIAEQSACYGSNK